MKVVQLSTSDGEGGAAIAALRLHQGLRAGGTDSIMLVGRKTSDDPSVVCTLSARRSQFLQRLDRQACRLMRTSNPSLISPAWIGSGVEHRMSEWQPDLVHLHWTCSGFLRLEALRSFDVPLLWSLHDMWAFAGGEHYVGESRRYIDGYTRANRPEEESGVDLNRWVWRRKQRTFRDVPDLTFLCVSEWLANRARESALLRDREIKVLHNGVDLRVFRRQPREEARAALGLPLEVPLVAFGAINATGDKRKGFDLLLEALKELRLAGEPLELVVFGDTPFEGEALPSLGFPIHSMGEVNDAARLALVYAASDVMVVPSREEAFGQTAAEAMACGTPVVAFRVGGLPEIVTHEVSGFLARPFDTHELARGVHAMLAARGRSSGETLAAACRFTAEQRFSAELQARRCHAYYEAAIVSAERRKHTHEASDRSSTQRNAVQNVMTAVEGSSHAP